jgi:hypothetical protein
VHIQHVSGITFMRYAQIQKIAKQNNLNVFSSINTEG